MTNDDADTVAEPWYDVYIRCEGSTVEVWWVEEGEALERILSSGERHLSGVPARNRPSPMQDQQRKDRDATRTFSGGRIRPLAM